MNRWFCKQVWLLCGVLALAGCPRKPQTPSALCKTDSDCTWKLPDGSKQQGFCVAGSCRQCTRQEHCEVGKTCVNGQCIMQELCGSDADCAAGSVCWQQRCHTLCEPGEQSTANCPEGFVCTLQGFCVQASDTCQQDADCSEQSRCEEGLCVSNKDKESSGQQQETGEESREEDFALQECLQTKHVFFAFDQCLLRDEDLNVLQQVAQCAKKYDLTVTLEAHTDHWGSTQYNMALADKRGQAAGSYLQPLVVSKQVQVVSFGSQKPARSECSRQACSQRHCDVNEEACAQNRRCDIVLALPTS
ncbi:MAG: OmpA family protein [Myxococcota bacterium]